MKRIAVIVGTASPRAEAGQTVHVSDQRDFGVKQLRNPSYPTVMTIPLSDQTALALAVTRFGGQVSAYSFQSDHTALRYALAAGASSAHLFHEISGIDFDLLLVGAGGAGEMGDSLPARFAEEKHCALVLDVLDAEPTAQGIRVVQDLGRGDREILTISGPAVLLISENAQRLTYVSHHRRRSVSPGLLPSNPSPSALEFTCAPPRWDPVKPRTKAGSMATQMTGSAEERINALLGLSEQPQTKAGQPSLITADAATCAQYLVRYLAHEGFISRRLAPDLASPKAESIRLSAGESLQTGSTQQAGRRSPRAPDAVSRAARRAPRPIKDSSPNSAKPDAHS